MFYILEQRKTSQKKPRKKYRAAKTTEKHVRKKQSCFFVFDEHLNESVDCINCLRFFGGTKSVNIKCFLWKFNSLNVFTAAPVKQEMQLTPDQRITSERV